MAKYCIFIPLSLLFYTIARLSPTLYFREREWSVGDGNLLQLKPVTKKEICAMRKRHTAIVATLLVALTFQSAFADIPRVGHTVNAYDKDQSPITGTLVSIDAKSRSAFNKRFVQVEVDVRSKTGEVTTTKGWYELVKTKKKSKPVAAPASSTCCQGTSPNVLTVNNGQSNVRDLRHYVGPVYFFVDNRSTTNVHPTTVVQQPPIASCPYCGRQPRYVGRRAFCPNYGFALN